MLERRVMKTEEDRWNILTKSVAAGTGQPQSWMTEVELYEPCEIDGEFFNAGIYRRPNSMGGVDVVH